MVLYLEIVWKVLQITGWLLPIELEEWCNCCIILWICSRLDFKAVHIIGQLVLGYQGPRLGPA
eukprot:3496410-Rhodomonas_salina.1